MARPNPSPPEDNPPEPPELEALRARLEPLWKAKYGAIGVGTSYGFASIAEIDSGAAPRWQLNVYVDPARATGLPSEVEGFRVLVMGLPVAQRRAAARAANPALPWIPGAIARADLRVPLRVDGLLARSMPECRFARSVEELARATVGKAVTEAHVPPLGASVVCRFYTRPRGGIGVECSSASETAADTVARALDAFWRVDAQTYGGENVMKWRALTRGR